MKNFLLKVRDFLSKAFAKPKVVELTLWAILLIAVYLILK